MQVSSLYLNGIKEGRQLLNHWRAHAIEITPGLLTETLASERRFMAGVSGLYGSAGNVDFCKGQIDFLENQLRRLAR